MTVKELAEVLNLEIISKGAQFDATVEGCFAGDLLSLAMSGVQSGDVWVTVQTNVNILGIAALTDAACVLVANGMNILAEVSAKAAEEEICLLRSGKGAYELCCLIGKSI